jgi:tetratricopeptide (TPR) repeat protein
LGQFYDYFYVVSKDVSNLSRAEEVLNKAISISPTNQQGYWALAQTKIYQNKLDEALSLSEKALDLDPESSQSNFINIRSQIKETKK